MTRVRRRRWHANWTSFRQPTQNDPTSSVIRNPCYLYSFFFLSWAFSICSVGPFFCWVPPPVFVGSKRFYSGSGKRARKGGGLTPPLCARTVLGPSVHLGALRCRRTTGNKVPRTTWFLWLSESGSRSRYFGTHSPGANVTGNPVMK